MKPQTRATSIWREIKPFAMLDISALFHRSKSNPEPILEHALNGHLDTNFPSPDDGDVITYDGDNEEWIAAPPDGGPPPGGGGINFLFVPAVGGTKNANDTSNYWEHILALGGGPFDGGAVEFAQNGISFKEGVPIAYGVFSVPRDLTSMKVTPFGKMNASPAADFYIYSETYAISAYAQSMDAVHYAFIDQTITSGSGAFQKFLLPMQMTFPNESSTTGLNAGDTFMIYLESGDNARFYLRGWLVEFVD